MNNEPLTYQATIRLTEKQYMYCLEIAKKNKWSISQAIREIVEIDRETEQTEVY